MIRSFRTTPHLAFLLLASGCNGCQNEGTLPDLLDDVDATPVDVWVGQGLGASPVAVPAYATNGLGAAVPGEVSVTSDATVSLSAADDGWGVAAVSGAAPARFTVTGTAGSATAAGDAWLLEQAPGAADFPAIVAGNAPTQLAVAAGGVAWAVEGEVWWAGWDGAPPARVLALPDAVTGLLAGSIDADGVTDLLVWSDTAVALLRGHDGGGLTWGAGWTTTDGRTVAGVTTTDLDGDALTDLGIALNGSDDAWITLLSGDGNWSFTPMDGLELAYTVNAVSVEDLDDDDVVEITVLTTDGLLRRYTRFDDTWAATLSGTEYPLDIGEGSRLLPSVDLTGDGVAELVALGPSTLDGGGWQAWVITAGAESRMQFQLYDDTARPESLGMALGDLTGDGVADYVLSSGDRLIRGTWVDTDSGGTFDTSAWVTMPASSAFALDDVDGDGVLDVIVGGSVIRAVLGDRVADDPADAPDVGTDWKVRASSAEVFGLDLLMEPVLQDVDGDAVVDLVALVAPSTGAGVALQGFVGVPPTDTAEETFRSGGTSTLTSSTVGAALDLDVCDNRAFALYKDDATTWLAAANLGSALGPSIDYTVAVTGTHIVCGNFAGGEVAVVDDAGASTFVDASGAILAGASIGAAGDVAAVDSDGDGLDELVACAEAGCTVDVADFDADGTMDLLVRDSTGVLVTTATTTFTWEGEGAARAVDADGDGVSDLVLGEGGAAEVIRGVPGGFSPGVAGWVRQPVGDAVQYGDLDGDGLPDAFFFGEDPDLTDENTDWVGTLLYVRAE